MRRCWASILMVGLFVLPCGASPEPFVSAGGAQIRPLAPPVAPYEPTSPERTERPVAPCIVEIVHARVLAAAATRTPIVSDVVGPSTQAHERRIERPPIASPSLTS